MTGGKIVLDSRHNAQQKEGPAMTQVKLISGDSHVLEPPNLWQDRVSAKLKGRAPHMISLPQGDAWIIEGAMDPIHYGLNQCGGLGPEKRVAWIRWEDARRSGWDPAARVKEIDEDKVDVEILYPTPRISIALYWNNAEPEWNIAMIRAYNDWLSEFCSHAPDRFKGLAMIPTCGLDAAVAEMERAMKLPGMAGLTIGRFPNGSLAITPEDDTFWAAAQALEASVNVHVSLANEPAGEHHRMKVSGEFRFLDAPGRALQFIRAGVFDRFPELNAVFAEVDAGWVPYVVERLDSMYMRRGPSQQFSHKRRPKDYFEKNIHWVYITDHYGVRNRKEIGVSQLMWSSDFPHSATDWPKSWDTINADFKDAPAEEKHAILAGNAARVYHI